MRHFNDKEIKFYISIVKLITILSLDVKTSASGLDQ